MSTWQSISIGFYFVMFFASIFSIMAAKDFAHAKGPIIAAICFGFATIWFSILYGLLV